VHPSARGRRIPPAWDVGAAKPATPARAGRAGREPASKTRNPALEPRLERDAELDSGWAWPQKGLAQQGWVEEDSVQQGSIHHGSTKQVSSQQRSSREALTQGRLSR